MDKTEAQSVSAHLADKLTQLEADLEARKQTPRTPPSILCELTEDGDELFLCVPKRAFLEALHQGTKAQGEGAYIGVEGEFTWGEGGKTYRFHLRVSQAWARVDMLVGGNLRR